MASQAGAPGSKTTQNKEALLKSYNKRLKDDVRSILENYLEIVKLGAVEEESQVERMTLIEEVHLQMSVRSNNMVRASESLLKLVSDVKQYLILNDFPSCNESITQNTLECKSKSQDIDQCLVTLRDEMSAELYELEEDYYSSIYKDNSNRQ